MHLTHVVSKWQNVRVWINNINMPMSNTIFFVRHLLCGWMFPSITKLCVTKLFVWAGVPGARWRNIRHNDCTSSTTINQTICFLVEGCLFVMFSNSSASWVVRELNCVHGTMYIVATCAILTYRLHLHKCSLKTALNKG